MPLGRRALCRRLVEKGFTFTNWPFACSSADLILPYSTHGTSFSSLEVGHAHVRLLFGMGRHRLLQPPLREVQALESEIKGVIVGSYS